MEELHVMDVRLRGCGFTLYPAADEANVDWDVMHNILFAINRKVGTVNDDGMSFEKEYNIQSQNPNIPIHFNVTDFEEDVIHKAVREDLITVEMDKCSLTNKCIDILRVAAAKQKELDDKGFHFCPCAMF